MIDKVKFWCHKILPLVYDASLSYYEFLCKVCSKLNEVIDCTNGLLADWNTYKTILTRRLVSTRQGLTKSLKTCRIKCLLIFAIQSYSKR